MQPTGMNTKIGLNIAIHLSMFSAIAIIFKKALDNAIPIISVHTYLLSNCNGDVTVM